MFYYLSLLNSLNPGQSRELILEENPSWTIMIYMSADNWLDDMVPKNLGHMKSVGSTDDVNIITLTDERGIDNTNLYFIELYDVNTTPLSVLDTKYLDELNLGDPKVLEDFVTWSMTTYPAKYYLLDLWGHGEGWKGVARDGKDYLTMPELDDALMGITESNNGKKLDIIGFDACDMGMLEVLYQIKNYTNIAIASEKEIPERGWPYYDILMNLTQNPELSPKELSEVIVEHYYGAYSSGRVDSEDFSVELSAIDLTKMDDIISNLEYKLTDSNFLVSYENPEYIDLYCYAEVNGFIDLMAAINASVIAEKHWSNPIGDEIEHVSGIAIYYPKSYNNKYNSLRFAADTQWDEGIKGEL